MKKIALIGLPYYGHVMPILPLLKGLSSAGYKVHYYNTDAFKWAAIETGVEFYPYRSTINHYPPVNPLFTTYHEEIGFVLPQVSLKILKENYDLIIYDELCPWIKCLILTYQFPSVCIHTTYPTAIQCDEKPYKVISDFEYSDADENYIRKSGLIKYAKLDSTTHKIAFNLLAYLNTVVNNNKSNLPSSKLDGWTLLSATANLDIVLAPEFFFEEKLGIKEGFHYLATFQDLSPPKTRSNNLIYISLGTSYGELQPLLAAIENSTNKHKFEYLVSTGNRHEDIENTHHSLLQIKSFVKQHKVLSKCAAFITHCGMNSVMEAILTETPTLLRPYTLEQRLTAKILAKLGLGIPLEELTAHKINMEDLVYEASNSHSIKQNLHAYREKVVSAGGLNQAMELINQLLG